MPIVHVECRPDEALVKLLGISRRMVYHHGGKSRVFSRLKTVTGEVAMVDEDPGSIKTEYETGLEFIQESYGIRLYNDERNNKILILKIKLEDWILGACKTSNVDITRFGFFKTKCLTWSNKSKTIRFRKINQSFEGKRKPKHYSIKGILKLIGHTNYNLI